jgi:Na+/H+-dicarboxylate symporter
MVIVLKAVNLPVEGIAMILAVDRLLDMLRTAVNVWGDTCGTVVVANLEAERFNR